MKVQKRQCPGTARYARGQRSFDVFCAGVFLAFVAHYLLEIVSNAIAFEVVVSIFGIATMVALARYKTWEKRNRSILRTCSVEWEDGMKVSTMNEVDTNDDDAQ